MTYINKQIRAANELECEKLNIYENIKVGEQ